MVSDNSHLEAFPILKTSVTSPDHHSFMEICFSHRIIPFRSTLRLHVFHIDLIPSPTREIHFCQHTGCYCIFMLLIHPMWLFDVGFQLSFAAVTSILMFYSRLNHLYRSRYWFIRKIWNLMSVSIAAQIGTAPLVIFYFARFSTHFLLTNLWVIPMVSFILYAAIILLLLTPFEPLQILIAPYIEKLIQIQNSVLQQIELWPYASFDHLYLDACEVFLIYLILLLFYRFLKFRIPTNAYALLSALLIFSIYHTTILVRHTPSPGIAFYNIPDCPSVHCLSNGPQSWLVCSDSIPRTNWLYQSLISHWNSMGLSAPIILTQRYNNPPILLEITF